MFANTKYFIFVKRQCLVISVKQIPNCNEIFFYGQVNPFGFEEGTTIMVSDLISHVVTQNKKYKIMFIQVKNINKSTRKIYKKRKQKKLDQYGLEKKYKAMKIKISERNDII